MKKRVHILLAALIASLAGLPLPAQHARGNPPVNPQHTLESNIAMPPQVTAMLRRACYDCHSNETHWRWYSRMPLLSSLVVRDVERARRAMNLSEWSERMGPRPRVAASTLMACCAVLQVGKMPKFPYPLFHPKARLSAGDKRQFCEWSKGQALGLIEQSLPSQ